MTSVLSNLSGSIGGVVGGTKHWVAEQWTQRVVQVSVYAAIVFFVLSSYPLIGFVEKHVWNVFGVKLGKEGTLALHSVIFGLFMYVGTRYILDPLMGRVVEGAASANEDGSVNDSDNCNKDFHNLINYKNNHTKEEFSSYLYTKYPSYTKLNNMMDCVIKSNRESANKEIIDHIKDLRSVWSVAQDARKEKRDNINNLEFVANQARAAADKCCQGAQYNEKLKDLACPSGTTYKDDSCCEMYKPCQVYIEDYNTANSKLKKAKGEVER